MSSSPSIPFLTFNVMIANVRCSLTVYRYKVRQLKIKRSPSTTVHREHRFNAHYGIAEVAWRVATLRDTTTEAVLKATTKTASLFFSLRTPL